MRIKRKAIVYRRTAIKRPGEFQVRTRKAQFNLVEVTYYGKTYIFDKSEAAEQRARENIGKRMYICFGRTNCLAVQQLRNIPGKLLKKRIRYLKRFKKTLDFKTQTLLTREEQNAVLGNVKIHN
jgi:hypothetical protein